MEGRLVADNPRRWRQPSTLIRLLVACLLWLALGLSQGQPLATHAQTSYPVQRSASAYGSGSYEGAAAMFARNNAMSALVAQVNQAGATCIDWSVSSSFVAATPIGFVYQGTATASCTN
jgi:hypothetical protein